MKASEYNISAKDYQFLLEILHERKLEIENYMVEEPAVIAESIQKVQELEDKLEMLFVDLDI